MRPNRKLKVECFVDADFAGLCGAENPEDPISVKPRTGFLIKFSRCFLLWVSKLQIEVALSTLHSEYVALSQSLRDLLPTKELLKDTISNVGIPEDCLKFKTKCTVFEDNAGALQVATSPRMTPTSKFIAVKYHWFRQHVDSGEINIVKVTSQEQQADMFTKGLQGELFRKIRKLVCGW